MAWYTCLTDLNGLVDLHQFVYPQLSLQLHATFLQSAEPVVVFLFIISVISEYCLVITVCT